MLVQAQEFSSEYCDKLHF